MQPSNKRGKLYFISEKMINCRRRSSGYAAPLSRLSFFVSVEQLFGMSMLVKKLFSL